MTADAFAAYDQIVSPFVEANQDLPLRKGRTSLLMRTQEELDARNRGLAALASGNVPRAQNEYERGMHNSLRLPDYAG